VTGSRTTALFAAGIAIAMVQHIPRASAQWWNRAPADFEECYEAANKSATPEEKSAALAQCNSKFAGRRKPGGGYTYYDFMQDRSFDIAGPNPTPEEQKYIDQQYTVYLQNQRRNNIAAAFAKQQQQEQQQEQQQQSQPQPQQASLKAETTAKIPLPQQRPKVMQQSQANQSPRGHGNTNCPQTTFSCEWPRLSETLNELKKAFTAPSSNTPSPSKKKS